LGIQTLCHTHLRNFVKKSIGLLNNVNIDTILSRARLAFQHRENLNSFRNTNYSTLASIYLEKGFLGFSALSKMSFFPVAEVFRIHGATGLTIECPCTILSSRDITPSELLDSLSHQQVNLLPVEGDMLVCLQLCEA
jgi:hypothetical protein